MDLLGATPYAGKGHDVFEAFQDKLKHTLATHRIDQSVIQEVIDSGFFAWGIGEFGSSEVRPCIADSYYGNKYAGLIEVDQFVEYLRSGKHDARPARFAEYTVKSIDEVRTILSRPEHTRYASRMSFRGQTTDFWVKRPIPIPVQNAQMATNG
jgi:hypothetical protein